MGGVTSLVMGTKGGGMERSGGQRRGCCSNGAVGVLAHGEGYLAWR